MIPFVMVDLSEAPKTGNAQMLIRCKQIDKNVVDSAADMLGMSQAQFIRVVVVRTAYKILQEAALQKQVEDESDKAVSAYDEDRPPGAK